MFSNDIAISIQALSKNYQIYDTPGDRLRQFVLPRLQRMTGKIPRQYCQQFRALEDVSFEVKKGETVGIIGLNGSGKSTLLQLICGTLSPSQGEVSVNGRVAALLELGAGFNPEFTGRENIYMNAAILGLSQEEINANYKKIVSFADIGDFIEQPVKTYSSGMYVRLAFAVAINVDPEILIIDEALAVGDMLFQAKCMIRLKQMADNGVTLLFVSHDTGTVKGLCQKCVLLENGRMVEFGKASDVVDIYIGRSALEVNRILQKKIYEEPSKLNDRKLDSTPRARRLSNSNDDNQKIIVSTKDETIWPDRVHRYGDGGARILDIKLLDSSRMSIKHLEVEQEFIIQVSIRFDKAYPNFAIGYSIRDLKGQMLVGSLTTSENVKMPAVMSGDIYVVEIISHSKVKDGIYTISVGIELPVDLNQRHILLDVVENAVVFENKFHPDLMKWFPSMVKVPAEFLVAKIP